MFTAMGHLQLLNSQNTKIRAEGCKKIKGMPFLQDVVETQNANGLHEFMKEASIPVLLFK